MPKKQKPPLPVRLPDGLKSWLKERATANLRSMNAEITALLLDAKRRSEKNLTSS